MRRFFENSRNALVSIWRRFRDWLTARDKVATDRVRPIIAEPELVLGTADPPQYRAKKSLSSYRELALYRQLTNEVGQDYLIFSKVRLGDVMLLSNEPSNRKHHNNQIQCKHFDFLLCNQETHQPLMAVELDDSSHSRFSRRESDEFKDAVCKQIGLPLLRLTTAQSYPKGSVAVLIRARINE